MMRALIERWLRGADTAEKLKNSMAILGLAFWIGAMVVRTKADTFFLGGLIFLAAHWVMVHAEYLQGNRGKGSST
jgi:hypothetical protein